MPITRRTALAALGAAAGAAMLPRRAWARSPKIPAPNAVAILYDPTRCIGCEECVRACARENGGSVEVATRPGAQLTPRSLTVLRKFEPEGGPPTFRKVQCMHCVDPACASACMLGAMTKTAAGAVEWNGDLCVGCRYCEIACPFNVPRFEWETPLPRVTKCQMCPERRARGQLPACVDACHMGALTYGTRSELIAEAHRRIAAHPDRYNEKVYGEHDGGGTSVLYMAKAGVSFAAMGFPDLGDRSVPEMPETLQHTLYKGFAIPTVLLGIFGMVVRRNTKLAHQVEEEEAKHEHSHSEPVGGKILTWPFVILLTLFILGVIGILWRFLAGLGATTNMNDGYPMGLWIAFDVVTGTALACGGYAVAILVYLLNRGKYHPLVRAAIVTSALGYTLGGLSVLIDLGRSWNFYKIPLFFTDWNFNSILLEVALCIMLYVMVLWIELSPALFEGWKESRLPLLRRIAVAALPRVEKAMPYIIAIGLLLPTMHQSSLGSLMLLAGAKLHPLWRTPLLPLLFLVSCIGMGYAAVVLEATISSKVFRRPSEAPMLRALARPISVVLLGYALIRLFDVYDRGMLGRLAVLDRYTLLFHLEMTLFTVPALLLAIRRRHAGTPLLVTVAAMVILAGALYRFSTYLIAFNPGAEWSYFPSLPEFSVTIGLISAELMGYLILVKKFPILRGAPTPRPPSVEPVRERAPIAASPSPAGVSAMLLLALLLGAVPVNAQVPARGPDRRCLTDRLCLPRPLPANEPHEGVCATCHDFSTQATPAAAASSCASARCHSRPETLTPMHRGLSERVRRNCIGCHPPHNARIAPTGSLCAVCHARGGQLPAHERTPAPPVVKTVAGNVVFDHDRHTETACTACHVAKTEHAVPPTMALATCRSCHHTERSHTPCLTCHDRQAVAAVRTEVTRTLNIQVGTLVRPRRVLPFDHSKHMSAADCTVCHTGKGLALSADGANCSGCHSSHVTPTADCTACHDPPQAGVHTRTAHLGCDGAGCHENAPINVVQMPRTRSLCLVCHESRAAHQPGGTCADCHQLPPPRSANMRRAAASRP